MTVGLELPGILGHAGIARQRGADQRARDQVLEPRAGDEKPLPALALRGAQQPLIGELQLGADAGERGQPDVDLAGASGGGFRCNALTRPLTGGRPSRRL